MARARIKASACLAGLGLLGCLWAREARGQLTQAAFPTAVPVSDAPAKALQVVGNHLFIAAWGRGIQVLDISVPARPTWVGGWNPRKCAMGIHVVGNYAYVANRRAGLSVLDVSNPASPVLVGTLNFEGDAMAVNVAGGCAYVADYPTGFRIIDVRAPARPSLRGTGRMPQAPMSIHAAGDFACFAEPNGLHIFDVRNPLLPVLVASRNILGPVARVQIVGRHAHLATGQTGLLILDVADPASPLPVDSLMSETNNLPLVLRSSTGFYQCGYTWMLTNAGLRAFLQREHSSNMPADLKDMVATLRDSPFYPDVITRLTQIPRRLHGLHVLERYALALGTGLEVIDLANPARPKLIGRCELSVPTWDVRGAGRYAYVMDNGANIHIIDLADPARPVKIASFDSRGFASSALTMADAGKPVTATPPETYPDAPVVTGPPELLDPERLPDNSFAFTLVGVGNATYVVHASDDLTSWTPIGTNTLPAAGRLRLTDPDAAAHPHRLYRAVRQ